MKTYADWLIVEDFNNVLHHEEMINGQLVCHNEIAPFRSSQEECEVEDMMSRGRYFSWTNGTVFSKIDRALVNSGWM